jgi:N-acetylglutamate synthase-like GNAT family acetyltransferase
VTLTGLLRDVVSSFDGAETAHLYVWVARDNEEAWLDLGFARLHRRGTWELASSPLKPPVAAGLGLDRATRADERALVELDRLIDEAHGAAVSWRRFSRDRQWERERREMVSDPDVDVWVVRHNGEAVATLSALYGERVVEIAGVAVSPSWRSQGLANALIAHASDVAHQRGALEASVTWRVTNRSAEALWRRWCTNVSEVRLTATSETRDLDQCFDGRDEGRVLGHDGRGKTRSDGAIGSNEKLLEVPTNVTVDTVGVGHSGRVSS